MKLLDIQTWSKEPTKFQASVVQKFVKTWTTNYARHHGSQSVTEAYDDAERELEEQRDPEQQNDSFRCTAPPVSVKCEHGTYQPAHYCQLCKGESGRKVRKVVPIEPEPIDSETEVSSDDPVELLPPTRSIAAGETESDPDDRNEEDLAIEEAVEVAVEEA